MSKRPFVAWVVGSRDPILRSGEYESPAEAFEELTSGDSSFLVEKSLGIYEMGKDPEETLYDMTSPVALQHLAMVLAEYIAVNGPVMLCDGSDHVPLKSKPVEHPATASNNGFGRPCKNNCGRYTIPPYEYCHSCMHMW